MFDERPAGVTRVDRSARLDREGQDHAVALRLLPVQCADETLGEARAEPQRVADRHRDVADAELVGVRERRRMKPRAVHPDHREVVLDERPHELAREVLARRGRDAEGLRGADHMVVRDDVALRVEDDAGAEALARLDLHDRRRHLAVDVCERVLKSGRGRNRRGRARRSLARGKARSNGHEGRDDENRKGNPESFHATFYPGIPRQILRIRLDASSEPEPSTAAKGVVVGWAEPPAGSTVTATTEPRFTAPVIGTNVVPGPPAKRPAGAGAFEPADHPGLVGLPGRRRSRR